MWILQLWMLGGRVEGLIWPVWAFVRVCFRSGNDYLLGYLWNDYDVHT